MARFWAWIPFIAGAMATMDQSVSVGNSDISVSTSSSSTVIIISANNGGDAQTKYYNDPMMNAGMVHQVTVGGDAGLVYTPDSVMAAPGDMIQFNFMSKNHTVTQSSFGEPCKAMEGGVDSGFMPNADNTVNPPPMMMFQVMSTDPVWMYCRQTGHCGKGMVFSVNPTADKSQAAFKAAAMASAGSMDSSMGSGMAASSSAVAVAASSSVAVAASSSVAAVATSAAVPPPAASSSAASVAQGSGSLVNGGGACDCSCLCGVSAFPAGAGLGMMGGLSGSMPLAVAGQ
ncbi:serine-threonine rich protein, putative [Paecilomyces variotii No. 5]|uniref:Serine-threonine rich protein, putative n=1 Tax=Byssochlamys spectabilis (strain No. 5 / NBRC 109023) TaxID=1356009 RepID=V5FDU8_BYSSN|nr:serine-threonine rich protein, putative [Paecilomyces variotii No. 5]